MDRFKSFLVQWALAAAFLWLLFAAALWAAGDFDERYATFIEDGSNRERFDIILKDVVFHGFLAAVVVYSRVYARPKTNKRGAALNGEP